jgi:hypothetical protein
MISLTRLNAFKEKLTKIVNPPVPYDMVHQHKVNQIKSHILECYENVVEVSGENLDAVEKAFVVTLITAINGVIGKADEIPGIKKKNTKR